jgi:RNA polymerase sigma-70 factor (ECF subfamily)
VVAREGDEKLDDAAILRGLRAGEDWAARLAWNRYAPMVYAVLDRALGRAGESEDLTQEVFCRVFAALDSVRDPSAFRSYVYSAAVRILRWHLRGRRMRELLTLSDGGDLPDGAHRGDDAEGRDLLARFYRLLDKIPADDRTAFILRHVEGLRLDEIARATGVSLATVKRRVRRADRDVTAMVKAEPDLVPYFERAGDGDET